MRRSAAAVLTALVLIVSACASQDPAPSAPELAASAGLPAGWRWESYGGVQAGVPGDWAWADGSQRLSQWCTFEQDAIAKPVVGRPGAVTLVGCANGGTPPPETLVAKTGTVVVFDRTTEPPGVQEAGDQTAVRLDGVVVRVNAPRELRQRIVATIHRVAVDAYGCPAEHPIAARPQWRPAKPVDVASLRNVSSVSACKFDLDKGGIGDPPPRLSSSLRLDGSAAQAAIREVAKAPTGGGPDDPGSCLPEVSYGDQAIVLLVRSAAGESEIVLRYSGCDHNGFDDGVSVRTLTARAVAPFVAGPNEVSYFSGPDAKRPILRPGS
jgi:hypothetical protein